VLIDGAAWKTDALLIVVVTLKPANTCVSVERIIFNYSIAYGIILSLESSYIYSYRACK
jgi:hypothetical protein